MTSINTFSSDSGYILTIALGGSDYQVFAYLEEEDGKKNPLPSTWDSQTFEKIRRLTSGLLNAHEARRTSLHESPYSCKALDAIGLLKEDGTKVSHDFLIQPISTPIADEMANTLSLTGDAVQASAVKAQHVWNTIEEMIRRKIRSPSPLPSSSHPIPVSHANPSSSCATPKESPSPLSQTPLPEKPQSQENSPSSPSSTPPYSLSMPRYSFQKPITSADLSLRELNFGEPNWYDRIPDRIKLRIIKDILNVRCPIGGLYEKIWKLFETKVKGLPGSHILNILEEEKTELSKRCRALPSLISSPIRQEAIQLIEEFYHKTDDSALENKISFFMKKEFEQKEQLFNCIRQQAEAEEVMIENWDQKWAYHHYHEDSHRFVQALARWLDTY